MPRRDDYDDFNDRPRRGGARPRREEPEGRPGLATTAAVFWLVSAAVLSLSLLLRTVFVVANIVRQGDAAFICGGADLILVLGIAIFSAIAGVMTLRGTARSQTWFGALSLVLPVVMVFVGTVLNFLVGIEMTQGMGGRRNDLPIVMAIRGFFFSAVLYSGLALAGVFALSANRPYRVWSAQRRRDDFES